jgi:uncharacterized membrane protein HdeD (DUF308 family)
MGTASSPATMVKEVYGWSIALSVLLILAGICAIANPLAAGIAVTIFVGWLLIFSGCIHLVFAWYTRNTGGFFWELLIGILYIVIGVYVLMHLIGGLEALTIALAIYLLLEALLEFVLGFTIRPLPGSGWLVFDGILTLVLAVLIWRTWPSSKGWVLGLLVGVSMLFSGITRLALSLSAKSAVAKAA